jgi:diaminopimelate epimerase
VRRIRCLLVWLRNLTTMLTLVEGRQIDPEAAQVSFITAREKQDLRVRFHERFEEAIRQ